MGTNSLGRVYGKYTHSVGDGYGYSKLSIKFPEIMAVAALVIYAPGECSCAVKKHKNKTGTDSRPALFRKARA